MKQARERARALEAGLTIEDDRVPGRHGEIPIRRYRTADRAPLGTLIWLHGGAFLTGGLDQLESHAAAAAIARRRFETIAVDYRLVPRCSFLRDAPPGPLPGVRFPVPLEDVVDVCASVAETRPVVFLGGASAGAALTATASLRLAAEGKPVPAGMILAYGTFHAELPPLSPELRARTRGVHGLVQFRPAIVRRINRNYAGTIEVLEDPHAFPGGHPLSGLPPALFVDADRDVLRASSEGFSEEMTAAGIPVERHVVPGSRHGFLDRPNSPRFAQGIGHITGWLRSRAQHDQEQA